MGSDREPQTPDDEEEDAAEEQDDISTPAGRCRVYKRQCYKKKNKKACKQLKGATCKKALNGDYDESTDGEPLDDEPRIRSMNHTRRGGAPLRPFTPPPLQTGEDDQVPIGPRIRSMNHTRRGPPLRPFRPNPS